MNDIVVIGGGLAGTTAAIRLARGGREVTLLERETGPHEKVCGEFLSIEACRDLDRLGVSAQALGGVPIDRVRLYHRRHSAETRLPFVARGLSRAVLDEALLETAARSGAEVLRGIRVNRIEGSRIIASDQERTANTILLATGKHDLRGLPRPKPATREGYVGFKMHFRLTPAALAELGAAIELHVFAQGYAGLQRVGARDANLCLIVKQGRFAQLGSDWDALLAWLMREPALARLLDTAEPLFARPLAIANLPYGHIHAPANDGTEHLWRLGDQATMTASLTGDGMAGALRSGHLAADCLARGGSAADFHRLVAQQIGPQVRRAMLLQRLAERPLALRLGMTAARLWPALLGLGAKATRLPHYAPAPLHPAQLRP